MAGHIFFFTGRSACGKDALLSMCRERFPDIVYQPFYTTRAKRAGETEGKEYCFRTEGEYQAFQKTGKALLSRTFHMVTGPVRYFLPEGVLDLEKHDYFMSGCLSFYEDLAEVFPGAVCPVLIEAAEYDLLCRAALREKRKGTGGYGEVCRRFLSDASDYSEENIVSAGILPGNRFVNRSMEKCLGDIGRYIESVLQDE